MAKSTNELAGSKVCFISCSKSLVCDGGEWLDGFKFLAAGWVGDVTGYKGTPDGKKVVVLAKVRHSQSVSATPLSPWIAAESAGTVICAHCTCKAGLGEACSHISALLFALEAHTRLVQGNSACTSQLCQWLPPSLQPVDYCRIVDMDLSVPKRHPPPSTEAVAAKVAKTSTPAPSVSELSAFYDKLAEVSTPAFLSIVPGYADAYVPKETAGVPRPLSDLYDPKMLEVSFVKLLAHCEKIYQSISITPAEAEAIEANTREQAQSDLWFQYRAGRITASKFKSAVRTDKHQPSVSLIKAICYPQSMRFSSAATAWGCDHERTALDKYKAKAEKKHTGLSFSNSGLVVDVKYPFIGASPDGVVSCSCCGDGVIEVSVCFPVMTKPCTIQLTTRSSASHKTTMEVASSRSNMHTTTKSRPRCLFARPIIATLLCTPVMIAQ